MSGVIDSLSIDVGTKSLKALWERSGAISDNISNYDTPGYSEKYVAFEEQLSSALADGTLTKGELSGLNPALVSDTGSSSADGGSVDMEQQLIELMKTQLQYSYIERGVSSSLGLLMTASSEGGK